MDLTETVDDFLAGKAERFEVGLQLDSDVPQADEAVLFVSAPSEALKRTSGNVIVESVDREQVWEIHGFSITREVVEALAAPPETVEGVVEAVRASGRVWSVTERTGDHATPST